MDGDASFLLAVIFFLSPVVACSTLVSNTTCFSIFCSDTVGSDTKATLVVCPGGILDLLSGSEGLLTFCLGAAFFLAASSLDAMVGLVTRPALSELLALLFGAASTSSLRGDAIFGRQTPSGEPLPFLTLPLDSDFDRSSSESSLESRQSDGDFLGGASFPSTNLLFFTGGFPFESGLAGETFPTDSFVTFFTIFFFGSSDSRFALVPKAFFLAFGDSSAALPTGLFTAFFCFGLAFTLADSCAVSGRVGDRLALPGLDLRAPEGEPGGLASANTLLVFFVTGGLFFRGFLATSSFFLTSVVAFFSVGLGHAPGEAAGAGEVPDFLERWLLGAAAVLVLLAVAPAPGGGLSSALPGACRFGDLADRDGGTWTLISSGCRAPCLLLASPSHMSRILLQHTNKHFKLKTFLLRNLPSNALHKNTLTSPTQRYS